MSEENQSNPAPVIVTVHNYGVSADVRASAEGRCVDLFIGDKPAEAQRPVQEADHWLIEVSERGVTLKRLRDVEAVQRVGGPGVIGKVCESYPMFTKEWAAVAVAAITQGFQPPRDRRVIDRPAG